MSTRKYDSTVGRIAGNLLSGVTLYPLGRTPEDKQQAEDDLVARAVHRARRIVARVIVTEPQPPGFDLDQVEGVKR